MNHLNNFSLNINLGLKYFLFISAIILRLSVSTFGQERISYNNSGLKVDLGVGLWAWPLPMDYDEDGDFDLVVTCPDKPYNGTYFFENAEGNVKVEDIVNKYTLFSDKGTYNRNEEIVFANGNLIKLITLMT